LSFMLEATQKEGDPKTLFLQTQEDILTTEKNYIETTRELPAFLAIPLVLSDFTAEGKSGRRIFKEILRQNLPYLKSPHHAPEATPSDQSNNTKSKIRLAPLRGIKKIFAFLSLKKESTQTPFYTQTLETQQDSQYPIQITPATESTAAQGLSAKESPEMRLLHSLRKDFDQAICSGNLWKGVIDATRMTEKSRQHLLQVVQSLAIAEGEKQNFHQLIQRNHLPSIIAWMEKIAASTPAIPSSTQQYIQSVLYRSSEAHTMQMLVQIAHIAEREHRAPHATEQQKMQELCDQLIETRTLLLGLDPTNPQLKKAQDPNFWRVNLKAKAQTIAEHYPKDARYTTLTDDATLEWLNNIFSQGIAYHQYSVEGMHHIPKEGRCLVVFNHSLATYEIALFGDATARDHGRLLRMLVHDNFFKYSDYVAKKSAAIGFIPAKKDTTVRLLENEQMVGVCPGGIKEALKPSNRHKDDVMWETTKGFARISLLTGAPIVLAACPAANDLYSIKPSVLTNTVVNKLALPAPVFTSDAFPKPNPVKLTHYLSPAVYPPALPENLARAIDKQSATPERTHPEFKALLDQYHHQLWNQMQALMQEARTKDQTTQAH
jgi:1-acyl-sn-glycerol-3-phosphate acyltransferase